MFGSGFTYEVSIYNPCFPFTGTITGSVKERLTNNVIEGTILSSEKRGSALSITDGLYIMKVLTGSHNITCSFSGYEDALVTFVILNDFGENVKDIFMDPISNPYIDIKSNGSDGPVTIERSDKLIVTVSLNPKDLHGKDSYWWTTASTPFAPPDDRYYSDLSTGWTPGLSFTHQGPLYDSFHCVQICLIIVKIKFKSLVQVIQPLIIQGDDHVFSENGKWICHAEIVKIESGFMV